MTDDYCFACGAENPIGLHLTFDFDGERVTTKKILPREFQGYFGTAHGGILSTMMDEAMCKFIAAKYHEQAVTGRLEVRYKLPTPIERELTVSAWQESSRRNIISMRSTVEVDGNITAEATAKFAVVASA
ncbi:MAG: PaaI family thioesterase [Quinella sp. 2Q5]|nr:PaaI family thioesterase [Quinella sp. 2Q5]